MMANKMYTLFKRNDNIYINNNHILGILCVAFMHTNKLCEMSIHTGKNGIEISIT